MTYETGYELSIKERRTAIQEREDRLDDKEYWRNQPVWEFHREQFDITNAKLDLLLDLAMADL